jgi:hypothetical protein
MSRLTAVVVLLLVICCVQPVRAQQLCQIRLVMAVPNQNVSVSIDGISIGSLVYGQTTPYVVLAPGSHTISAGLLGQYPIELSGGQSVTAALFADGQMYQIAKFDTPRDPLSAGQSRITPINVSGGNADIQLSNGTALSATARGAPSPVDVPVGTYGYTVYFASGATLQGELIAQAGTAHNLLVFDGLAVILSTPVMAADTASGRLRVAHTVAGFPAFDVYINQIGWFANVGYGTATESVPIPVGEYLVSLYATGQQPNTATPLVETMVAIEQGSAKILTAIGTPDAPRLATFLEELSTPSSGTGSVTVVHTIPQISLAQIMSTGTQIAALPFGAQSTRLEWAGGTHAISIHDGAGSLVYDLAPVEIIPGRSYTVLAISPLYDQQSTIVPLVVSIGISPAAASSAPAAGGGEAAVLITPTLDIPTIAPIPTETFTPLPPTATATATATVPPTATFTATPSPTASYTPTATHTPAPTITPPTSLQPNTGPAGQVNTNNNDDVLTVRRAPDPRIDAEAVGIPNGAWVSVIGKDRTGEWLMISWSPEGNYLPVVGWAPAIYVVLDDSVVENLYVAFEGAGGDIPTDIFIRPTAAPSITPNPDAPVAIIVPTATSIEVTATLTPAPMIIDTPAEETAAGGASFVVSDFFYSEDGYQATMRVTVTNHSLEPAVSSGNWWQYPDADGTYAFVTHLSAQHDVIPVPVVEHQDRGTAPLWEFRVLTTDGLELTAYAGCEYHNEPAHGYDDGWFDCGDDGTGWPKTPADLRPGRTSASVPLTVWLNHPRLAPGDIFQRGILRIDFIPHAPNGTSFGAQDTYFPPQ